MSVYGLSEEVLAEARGAVASLRLERPNARTYSVPERCALIRDVLADGIPRIPIEIAEALGINRYEVSTALDRMVDELESSFRTRTKGGRLYAYTIR